MKDSGDNEDEVKKRPRLHTVPDADDLAESVADAIARGEDPTKVPAHLANVPAREERSRLLLMSRLLATGIPDEQIANIMEAQFKVPFSIEDIERYMERVFKSWAKEDEERTPHQKSAARRRMKTMLARLLSAADSPEVAPRDLAALAGAAGNLEKVLSGVEGTVEPIESRVAVTVTMPDVIAQLVGNRDPEEFRQIVERERSRLLVSGSAEVIERLAERLPWEGPSDNALSQEEPDEPDEPPEAPPS